MKVSMTTATAEVREILSSTIGLSTLSPVRPISSSFKMSMTIVSFRCSIRASCRLMGAGTRAPRTREIGLFLRMFHSGLYRCAALTGILSPKFNEKAKISGRAFLTS